MLDLQPSQCDSQAVSCQMRTISLQEKPQYEALSYVWGTPEDPKEVLLNGVAHPVTRNLYNALKALRHPQRTRTLWVDAVCINQDDLQERNAQVSMMDKVYLQAALVVVFWQKTNMSKSMQTVKSFAGDHTRHYTNPPQALLDFHLGWDAWFFRAWTFQEAVLAKDVVFHAGDNFLTIQDLEDYCKSIKRHFLLDGACCVAVARGFQRNREEPNNPFGATMGVLFGLMDARDNFRQKGRQPLLDVLNYIVGRSATDPRDRVYAFAGLAHDIPPDFVRYDIPLTECLVHITSRLIEHTRSLKSLQYVVDDEDLNSATDCPPGQGVQGINKRRSGLPTWCPDWTRQADLKAASDTNLSRALMRRGFAAGGKGPAEVSFPRQNLLRTSGILYDVITHLGKPSSDTAGWQYDRACLRQWCFMLANSHAVWRAYCDVCECEIPGGARYKCVVCDDYDACIQCLPRVSVVHPQHDFRQPDLGEAPEIVCSSEGGQFNIQGSYWGVLDTVAYRHVPNESLQTAFWKTMTADRPLDRVPYDDTPLNEGSNEDLATLEQSVAFTRFWNMYIEGHNGVMPKAGTGLTEDEFLRLINSVSREYVIHINTLVSTVLDGKRFFVTKKGYIGWGPKSAKVGDTISVLPGANVPFLVRHLTDETPAYSEDGDVVNCTLVGEAYVHGLMNGEALATVETGEVSEQTIVIH